jgi:hypothetical protein
VAGKTGDQNAQAYATQSAAKMKEAMKQVSALDGESKKAWKVRAYRQVRGWEQGKGASKDAGKGGSGPSNAPVKKGKDKGGKKGGKDKNKGKSSKDGGKDASNGWKSQGSQQNYQQIATTYPSSSTQWDSQGQNAQWKPSPGYQQKQNYNQNYNQNYQPSQGYQASQGYQQKQGYHGSYQNKTWKG